MQPDWNDGDVILNTETLELGHYYGWRSGASGNGVIYVMLYWDGEPDKDPMKERSWPREVCQWLGDVTYKRLSVIS